MADKSQHGFADMDEAQPRETSREGDNASHEKGNAHEFDRDEAAEVGRKGVQTRHMANASRETAAVTGEWSGQGDRGSTNAADNSSGEMDANADESPAGRRTKKTRGGTHDQHVTAGKKGGSRIRELIELGYKYEQEHGIGPGRNGRSKLAAQRKSAAKPAAQDESDESTVLEETEND